MDKKTKDSVKLVLGVALGLMALMMSSCGSGDSTPVSMGELDRLNLFNLDSTQFEFTKADLRGSLIAVVFSPGCDHCQAQAQEFLQSIDKLEDVTVLMIASESLQRINDFSVQYGLNEFKNVRFAYVSPVNALSLWNIDNLPHIVLYNQDLKPLRTFKSTTPVDKILSGLK